MEDRIQRVAVLYSKLSGYVAACLKALKDHYQVELFVVCWPPAKNAPFDKETFTWIDALHIKDDENVSEILVKVEEFNPEGLLISGWMDKDYLRIARKLKGKGIPVVAGCDTQWNGSIRQQLGRLTARWYLHSAINILWVAGERQRQLAKKFGFDGKQCWSGCYACDWTQFSQIFYTRIAQKKKSFLFVGRYIEVKGIDLLVSAYREYRERVSDPWTLVCAGTGDQKNLLINEQGIVDKGFVQPNKLPELLKDATAFVLPSNKEPWGVVVHEATASGLPVICSDASGASVHLLRDGFNGFSFAAGDVEHLTQCMIRMSETNEESLAEMGRSSFELSKQFTPSHWAKTLMQGVTEFKYRYEGASVNNEE